MNTNVNVNSILIYDKLLSSYEIAPNHPMRPIRLSYVAELLQSYDVFDAKGITIAKPKMATERDLLTFHTPRYINAIKSPPTKPNLTNPNEFNIGYGDNPIFPNMYSLANLIAGSSIFAAEQLYLGKHNTVFNIAGGLHHAMPNNASGFCIFNDPVIAINKLLGFGLKPAYIDIDCHHGDGVQHAFYETDQVLTISIHESGKYIFPGTGYTSEIGKGKGKGYSVNIPLLPYTTDEIYIEVFKNIVPRLIHLFNPDVIVAQLGIDTHYSDPLTHLSLTTQGYSTIVKTIKNLGFPILALGGGGYSLQAVSRGWASAFAILANHCLQDQIPDSYKSKYSVSTISDKQQPKLSSFVRKSIDEAAKQSLKEIEKLILPILKKPR